MNPNSRPRGGLQLWPVGPVLALTFITATTVAAAVFFAGWDLMDVQELKPEQQLTSSTLFDLVKLAFGVVAGAGALVALVVAYRRQRVDEDGALREATRLHTERFTSAVSQLGDTSAAVRLGGVHALAGLADDAPTRELRQTCIDVLCAYLRLPYTAKADIPSGDTEEWHAYLSLRQVRHTVIRLIRDHLRHETDHSRSWQGHDFDFTDVVFDGGDLDGAVFSSGTLQFSNAVFSTGAIDFDNTTFGGATVYFDNTTFDGANVTFRGATFSDGVVDFEGAAFNRDHVSFGAARFSGGKVSFVAADFNGGTVNFIGAKFCGSAVDFQGASFAGGTVDFGRATFEGGTVAFDNAAFTGGILDLSHARGSIPSGLPLSSELAPAGVRLPPAWD
ncbi:pentapeptide repeat-containing protein [Streptomyces sp. NPDC058665]|uniref:pentapeptide repeat-containing protein n=1 Tax=Streptomyces sp. NPDC058665 TaxID=3346586 RepID=UPI00365B9510